MADLFLWLWMIGEENWVFSVGNRGGKWSLLLSCSLMLGSFHLPLCQRSWDELYLVFLPGNLEGLSNGLITFPERIRSWTLLIYF